MRSRSVRLESGADPTGRIMIFPHDRVADSDRDARSILLEIRLVDSGQATPPPAPDEESRPRLLRVEEAAKMLAVSRAVLYPMLGRELTVVRIGRMVRVPLAAVETFIRKHSE